MEGAFECRGLKVNLEKTKLLVMGGERGEVVKVGMYPCGVCSRARCWSQFHSVHLL